MHVGMYVYMEILFVYVLKWQNRQRTCDHHDHHGSDDDCQQHVAGEELAFKAELRLDTWRFMGSYKWGYK